MEILCPNIQTKVVKKASVWLPLGHQRNGPQTAHANVTSDLAHIHFEPQGKLKKQILKMIQQTRMPWRRVGLNCS